MFLRGLGHVTEKKTCYHYDLYCYPHVAIVFCRDFDGWGESTIKLLINSTNISAMIQHTSVSVVYYDIQESI